MRNKNYNKRTILAVLIAGMAVGTAACSTKLEKTSEDEKLSAVEISLERERSSEKTSQESENSSEKASQESESSSEEALTEGAKAEELPQPYAKYLEVLEKILEERTDPNGNDYSDWDRNVHFENNLFAFADVDSDGRIELIFNFNESSMVGMREVVYEYDEETDTLWEELTGWIDTTYYTNGIVKVMDSHNHGRDPYERGTYPYGLYQYDTETDSYQFVYSIDAWDGEVLVDDFPEELDTDGDKLLYCITERKEDEKENVKIYNQAEYDIWVEEMMPDWCEIGVGYHPMTKEAIEGIRAVYEQAEAYAEQSEEWFIENEYGMMVYYLMYDMDRDGSPELTVNTLQGSGRYSDNYFYSLTDRGELKKLPLVRLCDSIEKEWNADFDLGGWYQIKAYQDQNGILYYEGHDFVRDGSYGGYEETGFYYMKDQMVYQDSIRNNTKYYDEIKYYDMALKEITKEQYEEIRENYVKDMTEENVYFNWVYFSSEEAAGGTSSRDLISFRLFESYIQSA